MQIFSNSIKRAVRGPPQYAPLQVELWPSVITWMTDEENGRRLFRYILVCGRDNGRNLLNVMINVDEAGSVPETVSLGLRVL